MSGRWVMWRRLGHYWMAAAMMTAFFGMLVGDLLGAALGLFGLALAAAGGFAWWREAVEVRRLHAAQWAEVQELLRAGGR